MMSASDMRRMRASVGTVPSRVLAARSRMDRALLCDRPAARSCSLGASSRCCAVGWSELRGRLLGSWVGLKLRRSLCVDGGGGLAVELLIDDGFEQGLKGGGGGGELEGEGAGAFDEAAEARVRGGERGDRKISTIGGRTRARVGAWHGESLAERGNRAGERGVFTRKMQGK